ncbi:hypothetical protein L1787_13120 [Acuticoccus sp. M5D2P5]|uniref:phage tail assembly chaperone n=1 Tax=Acuticoccus kalidii TaxID=2910977 RepID=UPI001F43A570|nr:hypothetical protein [Acuticoccus kalidii]MCF3934351.1 hypothetical protein [Acuticoccus kalidii]
MRLEFPDANGTILLDHYAQLGIDFDLPEPPECAAHVWAWFWQLSNARGGGGFSIASIAYSEIAAWGELTLADPTPTEIGMIKAMDAAFLDAVEKRRKVGAKPGKK